MKHRPDEKGKLPGRPAVKTNNPKHEIVDHSPDVEPGPQQITQGDGLA